MDRLALETEIESDMKPIRILFAALLLLTTTVPLMGQDRNILNVPSELSMATAMSIGARWNPSHRQVANDRGPAAWSLRNALANFLPSVSVNGGFNFRGSGTQNFGTTEFRSAATRGSSYGISVNWSLDANTLVQPGLQRAQLQATDASILGSEITVGSNIAQQYLVVLQARDEVDLARVQLIRNDEAVRLADAIRAVGQGTLLDVRQAQVLKGRSEVRLLQEQQDVLVEKLRLFELMGVSGRHLLKTVILTDSFPVVRLDFDLDELLGMAHSENPQLNALRSREVSAGWGVTSAKVNWYPRIMASIGWSGFTQALANISDVDAQVAGVAAGLAGGFSSCQELNARDTFLNSLGGNFTSANPSCTGFDFTSDIEAAIRASATPSLTNFTNNPFSFRLGVSIPIFSNFSRPLQVSRAHAQQEDARESVRAMELRLETDVSQAFYQMDTNFQTIEIQERNRIAAREALRLATEQYRLGSVGYISLQDAQVAAQQGEFDYIQALYAFHRSIAALESSVGRRLR